MKTSTARAIQCSAALTAAGLLLTACGSSGGSGSGQSEPAAAASFKGRGPITYVAGKDTTGTVQTIIGRWNKAHPKEKVTFIQLPTDADSQRQQMIQNAETKSDAYTVLATDVVWTSEFAAHQWIEPLPANRFPLGKMLQPVVETAKYRGKLYAVPASSNGGLLFYRTDLLKKAGVTRPPTTWAQMTAACAKVGCRCSRRTRRPTSASDPPPRTRSSSSSTSSSSRSPSSGCSAPTSSGAPAGRRSARAARSGRRAAASGR
ncbi:hypothetical protein SVIOM74S_03376 [Streptomyces violarus]